MRGVREMKKEFPNAHTVAKVELWRPSGSVKIDGPFRELESDLALLVLSNGMRGKVPRHKRVAMEKCLAVLIDKGEG